MPAIIGCDAHKQFSVFVTIDGRGKTSAPVRVEHHRQEYVDFLHSLPMASEIALEATGHWYWMVDEMEKAGHRPHLANPFEAKKRMGKTNKTDALDAKGLAILLHNGTLPESWVPPGELRDRRELLRTRMALRDLRSSLKHRIHAAIDRYGLQATGISDLFGVKGRVYIDTVLDRLPCDTAAMIRVQLTSLDQLEVQIEEIEERIAVVLKPSPEVKLLRTLPGIGEILAPLVAGDWRCRTIPARRKFGQLCRACAPHHRQWRTHPPRRNLPQRQPVSQVGLRGSSHLFTKDQGVSRNPRRTALSTARTWQRTWPRRGCRRSASGRSQLLGVAQAPALQRSVAASRQYRRSLTDFVQVRLNARHA
jgi:transposase